MDTLKISKANELNGTIKINGFKHFAVLAMSAAILTNKKVTLKNIPLIEDTRIIRELLEICGGKVSLDDHELTIKISELSRAHIPNSLVSHVHGPLYLLPSILARKNTVGLYQTGGCNLSFGGRPVNQILFVLKKMGAKINTKKKTIETDGLKGAKINLQFSNLAYHSGATKTALIAGVTAKGTTTIKNAYTGYEIFEFIKYLRALGADIKGEGTKLITINGIKELSGGKYTCPPDLIEIITFAAAGAITNSNIKMKNASLTGLSSEIEAFKKMGVRIEEEKGIVQIIKERKIENANFVIRPGEIYSDSQPLLATMMTQGKGIGSMTDTIWPNRFTYSEGLNKMGAKIIVKENKAIIRGVNKLKGADVTATNLRCAAAYVLAGLSAEGETKIYNSHHLRRGYENIDGKLKKIGADIEVI